MPDKCIQWIELFFALAILFSAPRSQARESDRFLPHLKTIDPHLIISAAESLKTVIRECKPALVWNEKDMLWADVDDQGVWHFSLAEAQRVVVGHERPAWVALRGSPVNDDYPHVGWAGPAVFEYSFAAFAVSEKIPQSDGGAGNFAVVLSRNEFNDTVYEIGWQADIPTNHYQVERRVFVLRDAGGKWHFLGEKTPPDQSSHGNGEGDSLSSTFEVHWLGDPARSVQVEAHVLEGHWVNFEDSPLVLPDLEVHRDGILANTEPSIRWTTDDYIIAGKRETIDTVSTAVGIWTDIFDSAQSAEYRARATKLSREKILTLNPGVFDKPITAGTHIVVPDLGELKKQLAKVPREQASH